MSAGLRVATIAALSALSTLARADSATELARVGESTLSVAHASAVISETPVEALSALGPTAAQIKARFVDEFIVSPALLEEGARRRAAKDEHLRDALQPRIDYALQLAIERQLALESTPTPEQVQAFYERHKKHYQRPEAIRIWRILVSDPVLAQKIIDSVQGKPDGAAVFKKLAREHSLDTATRMRSGDLGFAHLSGHTDVPQVRVNKGLVLAASKLKDGELAAEPFKEGEYLAVYWRRGTRPAVSRSLEEEAARISAIIRRDQARDKLGDLIGRLRKQYLVEGDLTLLESIKYPKASVSPVPREALQQRAATGSPEPKASSEVLR